MRVITNDELRALKQTLRGDSPSTMPWSDGEIYRAVPRLAKMDPTATPTELVRLLLMVQHDERQAWIDARRGKKLNPAERSLIEAWIRSMTNEDCTF